MAARPHLGPIAGLALVVAVCASCSALPADILAALESSPAASVAPSIAAVATEHLSSKRTFVVEKDGVRAAVHFQAMPLVAGKVNWLTTTLTNVGSNDLTWFHDGCSTTIGGYGRMAGAMDMGVDQPGNLATFKRYALDFPRDGTIYLPILRPGDVLHGESGCDDIGLVDTIKPGQTIRQRMGWNGQENHFHGLPPDGPVEFSLKFEYYGRPGLAHSRAPKNVLAIPASGWVTGGKSADRLDAPQIVDAALRDPGFRQWALALPVGYGNDLLCWYRPDDDVWWVGALSYSDATSGSPGTFHIAIVDPVTGVIREVIDRPWNPDTDPSPD
jgi:hypothetical protein